MFAVWEYEEDNWRSISFLKLVKDLMALTLDGRLFHKLTWRRKKIDAMSEISKKRCKASLKTCRCCNSTLKRILDWFGKTAKKENLVEKVKDIG